MRKNKGQTLLEVILASAVAVTVISALVVLGVTAMRGANMARNQAAAVKLANEGMEVARADRDASSWSDFLGHYPTDENPVSGTHFRRQKTVSEVAAGKAKVVVTVSWFSYGLDRQVEISSYLTSWR